MRRKVPSISALTCFEATARYESFSLAAKELGITQGSNNRQVRELEKLIGTQLFRREGRSVRLTDAGVRFSIDLSRDLKNLDTTIERAISSGTKRQHIAIGAPPTFAAHWLVPRLKKYFLERPDVTFSIKSYSEPFDLLEERIDLAIHFGAEDWPGGKMQPLCPEDVVVVVSSKLAQQKNITGIEELDRVAPLYLSSRPDQWSELRMAHNLPTQCDKAGILFDQFSLVISAVIAGLGAALIPSYFIENELCDGSLKAIAAMPSNVSNQYYVVTQNDQTSKDTANLAAWLRREGAKSRIERVN